jgi:hypothetical protein
MKTKKYNYINSIESILLVDLKRLRECSDRFMLLFTFAIRFKHYNGKRKADQQIIFVKRMEDRLKTILV